MKLRCIQHVSFEDAGAIATWAHDRGHEFDVTLSVTDDYPSPDDFDWLVVMGGPMGVHDELRHPWLVAEKALIRNAIKLRKRILGVCLGAQLVANVLGAEVGRNPEPEIGWFPVDILTDQPPFDVLPRTFTPLHWHGDTFALPDGATHAASSAACENQAFVLADGRVVGLQFHLESTSEGVARLVEHCGDELVAGRWVVQAGELLGAEARFAEAHQALFAMLDRMATL